MKFNKINWCLKQAKGIKLTEPNENISRNYMKEAMSDLDTIDKVNVKWKVITSYYSCYNALYSILVKIGIKCEIHDCTISLMELLGFDDNDIEFMISLKGKRINAQYYLKSFDLLVDKKEVTDFVIKCKKLINALNDKDIKNIISKLK